MDQKDKPSDGTLYKVFGVAKKLSARGMDLLNQRNAEKNLTVNASSQSSSTGQFEKVPQLMNYQDPRDMLREHLPNVSRQVLGRHFQTLNRVTHFISPELNDKVSDYFFDHLNQFSSESSSIDAILDESGIRDLEELTQDVDRSKRISAAFAEQNKWLASVQGAISGATGVLGSAIDIPASLVIALRVIYQVGRSYGFDLEKEQDQEVVQYIFKHINLGLIAEKQTILMGLKALMNTVNQHDISQLQRLLGSDNDIELLKRFLSNQEGQLKWSWVNQLNSSGLLRQLTRFYPIAGAGVGAVYSWRLVEDVHHKAQEVFSLAREYLLEHKEQIDQLTPIAAYEKAVTLLTDIAENSKKIDTTKILESLMTEQDAVEFVQYGDVVVPIVGKIEQVPNLIQSDVDEGKAHISSSEAELSKKHAEESEPIQKDLLDIASESKKPDAKLKETKPLLSVEDDSVAQVSEQGKAKDTNK